MKKTFISLLIVTITLIGTSAFIIKSSTGIAGYTGSPGEATCANCHGGGNSAASGITITSVPEFSQNINSEFEYLPDSTYKISIIAKASGFSRFGFGCEILDDQHVDAGVMQNPGAGVQIINPFRTNAIHTAFKFGSTVSFDFEWVAPPFGNITIYSIANAVNGNGNTGGDFVLAPVSMNLVPGTPPNITRIASSKADVVSQISFYPNPTNDFATISYFLKTQKKIVIELIDIKGTLVKELYSGTRSSGHSSQILNLENVASGVYFIRTSADNQKVSQKLITVQ